MKVDTIYERAGVIRNNYKGIAEFWCTSELTEYEKRERSVYMCCNEIAWWKASSPKEQHISGIIIDSIYVWLCKPYTETELINFPGVGPEHNRY